MIIDTKEAYARARARGAKKIVGLRFGDRLKVKLCGSDTICDGYITFIDHETGDTDLQMHNGHLPLSGIDDWQIVG